MRGAKAVFESPALATALYVGAVVAVMVTTGLRKER